MSGEDGFVDYLDVFEHSPTFYEKRESLHKDPEALAGACIQWRQLCAAIYQLGGLVAKDVVADEPNANTFGDDQEREIISKQFHDLTFTLAWWCDFGPYSIDPTPIFETYDLARRINSTSQWKTKEEQSKCAEQFIASIVKSWRTLDRMFNCAFHGTGREPPVDLSKLYDPTPATLEAIGYIQKGLGNEEVREKTGKSAKSIRKIRSNLGLDRYNLES